MHVVIDRQNMSSITYYHRQEANVIVSVCPFVCLSVSELDHANTFPAIFMKLCSIIDYCYGKDRIKFWGLIVLKITELQPL